ncbi:phage portal protein [Thermicanus aegyptius]|uniref:phage portal protein n=1 Tax=Thermicanus aegyptius TaxID=94009 RepID=UPI0004042BBA|nr:phage portal protein [Thermicanus aegyptius]
MSQTTAELIQIIEAGAKSAMSLEQIIKIQIDEWLHSTERQWMITGQRYYISDHDILQRKRTVIGEGGELVEVTNLANNKLVHAFVRKLVDQKVGYLLGKPLTIQTENAAYLDLLNDIFNKSFLRLLKNLGKEAVNKGKAWLHVYYNEEGQLSFKKIPSEEIIPLWRDAAHTELDAAIRVYDVEAYEGTTKKIITKVEFWDTSGVRRYVLSEGGLIPDVEAGEFGSHFTAIQDGQEQGFNWERVPFVCFKYNDEEIPLVQVIKSLVDDYDVKTSDNSNNLEDLPNSIYVVRNYDGQDLGEFRRNLSVYRAVKVTDDGGVDTLSLEINVEAFRTHIEQLRKDIYEFGRGVLFDIDRVKSAPSGVALKFLYADLDMDCNIIETEFQAALEQLLWFINTHLTNTGVGDFSNETVEFIFNRDIIISESDVISDIRNSVGILSEETLIANHPFVTDVQAELERIRRERNTDMVQFGHLGQQPQGGGEQA